MQCVRTKYGFAQQRASSQALDKATIACRIEIEKERKKAYLIRIKGGALKGVGFRLKREKCFARDRVWRLDRMLGRRI
jgi:hypothetical protein